MYHKTGIIVGRFQPVHKGHISLITKAASMCEKLVIVIGSENSKFTIHNPWTVDERIAMISAAIPEDVLKKVTFNSIKDYIYDDDLWYSEFLKIVSLYEKPVLFGNNKDHSTSYLERLSYHIDFEHIDSSNRLTATQIRDAFFTWQQTFLIQNLHKSTLSIISEITNEHGLRFMRLSNEHMFHKSCQLENSKLKHDPFFVTCDNILIHNNKVLLVIRGKNPGLGELAFPGGFLESYENVEDGAIRELYEETQIKVRKDQLRTCIKRAKVYDYPKRSLRGRVITHAFLYDVSHIDMSDLKVIGSDDAVDARWYNIASINEHSMFEDHFDILHNIINS